MGKNICWYISDGAHAVNIFCRSDGKDEKSEGEGKDGKGEKFGIISSLYISSKSWKQCQQTFSYILNNINFVWQGEMKGL